MKNSIRLIVTVIIVVTAIQESLAQIPPPLPPASETPLDGFSGTLLVAGAIYAARKAKNKKG